MKTIKLKPLFFPNDDILVNPPEFLNLTLKKRIEKEKNRVISNMNQLISILRGRRLKKSSVLQKPQIEEEKETVVKLSEWKNNSSPKSPLTRKFTFRRTFTLNTIPSVDQKSPTRSVSEITKPKNLKFNLIESLVSTVQNIVALERVKKKHHEEEVKVISENNQKFEHEAKLRIQRLSSEIKSLKKFVRDTSEKIEEINKNFEETKKKYEEDCAALAMLEAQELLFKDKEKGKKTIKPGEEKQYFMKKEKLRLMKQELHQWYLEEKEKYTATYENTTKTLEAAIHQRQISKKEMQQYREELIMMYCRSLKDGKDLRADGIRWAIKSIWLMNEPVPISAFPKFIDDESAHFLLVLSEKDLELEKHEKKLSELRNDIKSKRPSSASNSVKILYNDVRKRLKEISQSSIGQPLLKESSVVYSNGSEFNLRKITPTSYNEITGLRSTILRIHDFVKEKTTEEIKRVTETYQINAGNAEDVGLYHVIRCLVGDRVREFNKYTRVTSMGPKYRGSILLNY